MSRTALAAWVWGAVSLWLVGCGGSPATTPPPDDDVTQLRMVGALYGKYLSDHTGAPPANMAQFVAFLERDPAGWNKVASTPQQFLTSPRDDQPLVLVFGAAVKDPPEGGFPWIAHEATGVDGRVMIVNARGNAELKSPEQVGQLFPN
jgi:hypothetical protein